MTTSERDSSALLTIGMEIGRLREVVEITNRNVESLTKAQDALICTVQKCIAMIPTPPTTSPSTSRSSIVDRILGKIAQDALRSLIMRMLLWVWRSVPTIGLGLQFAPGLVKWLLEHAAWLF